MPATKFEQDTISGVVLLCLVPVELKKAPHNKHSSSSSSNSSIRVLEAKPSRTPLSLGLKLSLLLFARPAVGRSTAANGMIPTQRYRIVGTV